MVLQKFKRMLEADTESAKRYERTLLTAAVYELADTIADRQRIGWLKRLMAKARLKRNARKSRR
jgi:hypothetical protein